MIAEVIDSYLNSEDCPRDVGDSGTSWTSAWELNSLSLREAEWEIVRTCRDIHKDRYPDPAVGGELVNTVS